MGHCVTRKAGRADQENFSHPLARLAICVQILFTICARWSC